MSVAFWCDRRLVESPYHLALCLDEKAYISATRRMKIKRSDLPPWIISPVADATLHTFHNHDHGNLCAIVCLRERDGIDRNQVASLLVHEAVHLWQEIKVAIGEREPSKEFEAYSVQRIFQELIYAYDSLKARR